MNTSEIASKQAVPTPRSPHGQLNYEMPEPSACARFVALFDDISDEKLAQLLASDSGEDSMFPLLQEARSELQAEGQRP